MPFITTAAIVGGSLASAGIGAVAASKAAGAQKAAANKAASIDQQSLDFQKQVYADQQAREAPWIAAGQKALRDLGDLKFTAPTGVDEANDPGYKFRLSEGQRALENSAAARGNLLSGNTAKALEDYTQDYASNEFSKVYERAFNDYSTKYAKLSELAGLGSGATTTLGQQGQAAATGISLTGAREGEALQNAGAATASGYAGIGNALTSGIGNITQYMLLKNLLGHP